MAKCGTMASSTRCPRCGRENEARTLFKRALMLDPQNADASAALGGKRVNREVSDFFKSIFKK